MALQVVGGAAAYETSQRAVATRADHEEVQFVAERGELLARDAIHGATVDIGKLFHAIARFLDDLVDVIPDRRGDQATVGGRRQRDYFQRVNRCLRRRREVPGHRERCRALRRSVVGDTEVGDRGVVLGVAARGDRDRAGSAVQGGARVVAQHRATEGAVAAGADHE